MAERGRWWLRVQALLEHWPAYARGTGPQRGLMAGALVGLLIGGVAGVALGMINRGIPGAIVGGLSAGAVGTAAGATLGWSIPRRKVHLTADLEFEDTRDSYQPGDMLSGFVVLRSDGSALVHRATVKLSCVGRYVRDRLPDNGSDHVVYERSEKVYASETTVPVRLVRLHRGSEVRFPFTFALPLQALPTHHGFGCVIRWMVDLTVDAQHQADPVRREVVVASVPTEAPGGSSLAAVTCDAFQLSLSLPQLQYAEGDSVQGQVLVTPSGDAAIQELRLALVRVERLTEGDGHIVYFAERDPAEAEVVGNRQPAGNGTTYVWLEQHETLAQAIKLDGTRPARYPFTLPLARTWRPSVATAEGLVRWQLSAIASRTSLPDVQAALRLEVYTAARSVGRVLSRTVGAR